MQKYNVNDKHLKVKLLQSKRFTKYSDYFLSNTCTVRVNADDFFIGDEFVIQCKNKILPRRIYLYGKKNTSPVDDCIYLNYWLPVFLNTVEEGYLVKNDFEKSNSSMELAIGLPLEYRKSAFNCTRWSRNSIIEFLSCLFNIELREADFEQQDLLENFANAA